MILAGGLTSISSCFTTFDLDFYRGGITDISTQYGPFKILVDMLATELFLGTATQDYLSERCNIKADCFVVKK